MKQSKYDEIINEMYGPLANELKNWDIEQIKEKQATTKRKNACTLK